MRVVQERTFHPDLNAFEFYMGLQTESGKELVGARQTITTYEVDLLRYPEDLPNRMWTELNQKLECELLRIIEDSECLNRRK